MPLDNFFTQFTNFFRKKIPQGKLTDTCAFIVRHTRKRCNRVIFAHERCFCRGCGVLICNYHSRYRYKGYKLCDACYNYIFEKTPSMPKRKIEIPNVDRDDPINDEALKIFVKAAKRYSDKTENLVSKNACTLYTRLTSQFIVGEKNNFDITEVEEYLNAYDTAEDPEQVTDIARMDLEDFLRRRGDLTYLTGFKCGDKFLNEGYYYVGVQLVGDNNFSSHALNMHVSKNGIISVIDARKGILEIFDSYNYLEKINHIHRTSFNHVTIEMMIPFS